MTKWLALAACGALGTVARVQIYAITQRFAGSGFPWGTVAVNLLGSLAFGLLWGATEGQTRSVDVRFFALAGFLAAFTTFSTFVFEVEQLMEAGRLGAAVGSLLLQNGAGIICVVAGLALGRAL
jgi:CrcB protein